MPETVFADIATLRKDSKVDDYFIIHLLRPSRDPEVKITLKSSYLMCASKPVWSSTGREGSYVKYGFDPQEAALNEGDIARHSALGRGGQILLGDTSYGKGR